MVTASEFERMPRLSLLAAMAWAGPLAFVPKDVEPPPGASRLELPGPERKPVRPQVEPTISATGAAARAVEAGGVALRALVVAGDAAPIALDEPPLAVAPTAAGAWVLGASGLSLVQTAGGIALRLDRRGLALAPGSGESVWLLDGQTATHVEPDGTVAGPYPWPGLDAAPASGGGLAALLQGESLEVRLLAPDGAASTGRLPAPVKLFERLLAYGDGVAVTLAGSLVRLLGAAPAALPVQSAGLTAAGEPFVSGRIDGAVHVWSGTEPPRRLLLPADVPPHGAFRAVAVDGDETFVFGLDRAYRYAGEQVMQELAVDEETYRTVVFPRLWETSSIGFAAARPDGDVVIGAGGPDGLALIGVAWGPEPAPGIEGRG